MKTTFVQSNLWENIQKYSKKAKRKHVAVAYLGSGASNIISLGKGDTLVVDMSLNTIKSGQTNPFEIEKYIKSGVMVYTCSNLHAKVYLFDNTVIISSGNLSNHSQNTLVEAGVVSQDQFVVKSALGFIRSIQRENITPEYLKMCQRSYNPPRFGGKHIKRSKKNVIPAYSKLWVCGITDYGFTNEEKLIDEKESNIAMKDIKDFKKYELASLVWPEESSFTRNIKKGDLLIQIYHQKVYPPSRIVRITKYKFAKRKNHRYMVFIEEDIKNKPVNISAFKKIIAVEKIKKIGPNSTREIKSPSTKNKILGMWS